MDLSFLCQLPDSQTCRFVKGEYLIRQGEAMPYIYYLQSGRCERIEYSDCGDEIIFNTKMSGSGLNAVVGLNNLWNTEPVSFSSFLAKTNVICCRIDAALAKEALLLRPDILDAIISLQMDNYLRLRALFKCHQERRTPSLLCDLLLKQADPDPDGRLRLPKSLTNVSISRQLGVHQVTVAKIMAHLQKEALIKRTPQGLLLLDPQQLEAYANGQKMAYL